MTEISQSSELNETKQQMIDMFRKYLKDVVDKGGYKLDLSGTTFPDSVDQEQLKSQMATEASEEDVIVFFTEPDLDDGTMAHDTVSYGMPKTPPTWREESEAR